MSKSYLTKAAAVAAVKKWGLQLVPHSILETRINIAPVFYPELEVDRNEILSHGFLALPQENAPWYPEVGKIYQHYKGDRYIVIGVGPETETMRIMVGYKPLYECDIPVFFRWLNATDENGKLTGWMDPMPDNTQLRFAPIED